MNNDDERNVDEQLDEEQQRADKQHAQPLIENHQNNTRMESVTNPRADQKTNS